MWDRNPVRLSLLHMLPGVAEERGLRLGPLLARAGLAEDCRFDPETVAGRAQLCTLVNELSRKAGEPTIGLDLAAAAEPARLGPPGEALIMGHTLRECLATHARHMPALQAGVRFNIEERDGRAHWSHHLLDSEPDHARVLNEGIAAFMIGAIRAFTGPGAGAMHIALPHRPAAPTRFYEDRLEVAVSFGGREAVELSFDAAMLDRVNPFRTGSSFVPPGLHAIRLEDHPGLESDELITVLTRLIEAAAWGGTLSLPNAARNLGIPPRSLQRQLARLGTSFEALVDNWRRTEARRRLADPALPVGAVARLLGYEHHAHFVRAFRRWEGQTPLSYRRLMRDQEPIGRVAPNGNC